MKYIAVIVSGALAGLGGVALVLRVRRPVPERADERPGVHRPGRHDLRQLAGRRAGARCRAVRLHGRPAEPGAMRPPTRSCSWRRSCSRCWRSGPAAPAMAGAAIVAAVAAVVCFVWYDHRATPSRPSSSRSSPTSPRSLVLVFSAQRLRPPAADGRVFRRVPSDSARPVDWEPLRSAAAEVVQRAYAPYSRPAGRRRRRWSTTADRRRLQRRERVVRADAVRRVRPGVATCTPPAAGGWWRSRSSAGDGRVPRAVRSVPAGALEVGGPEPAGRRPRCGPIAARPSCSPAPSGPATCPSPATPAPDPTRWPPTSSR